MMMAFGLIGLSVAISGSASAVDPDYATVTGHEAFSEDANHASYWGSSCVDGAGASGDSYVLPAGTYTKVIVKSGAGEFANTIFAAPPTAGQTVWADTNGNNAYDPGGQDGDKQISHIIVCTGTPPPPDKIDIPAQPSHNDPCGPNNSSWNVPADTDVLHWALSDAGHLVVSIVADDVTFSDGTLMHDYGVAPESNAACVSPPKGCPAGTEWVDLNNDGVVQNDKECIEHITPHPDPAPPNPPAVAETGIDNQSSSVPPMLPIGLLTAAGLLLTGVLMRGKRREQKVGE
jgi:hypothetical protein